MMLRVFRAMGATMVKPATQLAIMLGLAMPATMVHAQLAAPDRASLNIAQLVQLITVFVDEQDSYEQLSTDLLSRWNAVPEEMIGGEDGTLVSGWDGEVRAAPFDAENTLARLHLVAVPRAHCVELAFLLLDRARVIGLYINGTQLDIDPESFGDLMLKLGETCPSAPSTIDVIIR